MHAGTLEPSADGGLAAGLDDTGTNGKSLGTEVGVLHPVAIALDILGALTRTCAGPQQVVGGSGPQGSQKVIQTALGQGLATRFGPRSRRRGGSPAWSALEASQIFSWA